MTWLIALFARWGLAGRVGKLLVALTLLAAAIGVLVAAGGLWLHFHDKAVIASDRAESEAVFRERQIAAERKAGAAKVERDTATRESIQRTQEECDEADRRGGSCLDAAWGGLFD